MSSRKASVKAQRAAEVRRNTTINDSEPSGDRLRALGAAGRHDTELRTGGTRVRQPSVGVY